MAGKSDIAAKAHRIAPVDASHTRKQTQLVAAQSMSEGLRSCCGGQKCSLMVDKNPKSASAWPHTTADNGWMSRLTPSWRKTMLM